MAPRTRSAEQHELELRQQHHLHQVDLVVKDETSRRQRITMHQLRDQNETLRDESAEKDKKMRGLTAESDKLRADLEGVQETCRSQEKQLKSQDRDMARLKAELQSLNEASQDSSKTLAEKLAISRELDNLRPEVEHLRSQLENHNTTISEKLTLERRVASLEVELEDEKRSAQRTQARKDSKAVEEVQRRLDEAEARLASEKMAADKAQREAATAMADMQYRLGEAEGKLASQKQSRERNERGDTKAMDELRERLEDAESKLVADKKVMVKLQKEKEMGEAELRAENESLLERIESLKIKLRVAQAELKTAHAELEAASHKQKPGRTAHSTTQQVPTKIAKTSRKRQATEMALDGPSALISTPGNDARAKRPLKKGVEQSLLGEKSAFSITPFLAKSRALGDDTVLSEPSPSAKPVEEEATRSTDPAASLDEIQEEGEEEEADAGEEEDADEDSGNDPLSEPQPETSDAPKTSSGQQPKARGRPRKALGESASAKKNMAPALSSLSKTSTKRTGTKLGLMEIPEDGVLNEDPFGESKKKKRKLGNSNSTKTLLDDVQADDEIGANQETEMLPPPQPKRATKTTLGAGSGARKVGKMMLGPAAGKAFGGKAFSPLKRDRRGVHASFLA